MLRKPIRSILELIGGCVRLLPQCVWFGWGGAKEPEVGLILACCRFVRNFIERYVRRRRLKRLGLGDRVVVLAVFIVSGRLVDVEIILGGVGVVCECGGLVVALAVRLRLFRVYQFSKVACEGPMMQSQIPPLGGLGPQSCCCWVV